MGNRPIDLNQMLVFARVVELRRFSAAAEDLGLPRTTVSKRIRDLEARLGTPLLTRTTRKVAPTDAGQRFYAHCAAALREIEAGELAVGEFQNVPRGMLRIGAPSSVGVTYLMPILIEFQETYPEIQLTVLLINEDVDMTDTHLDVLVQVGDAAHPGFATRLLARAPTGLYASPAYLARRRLPQAIADLAAHDFVGGTMGLIGGRIRLLMRRTDGTGRETMTPDLNPRFLGNDGGAISLATLGGLGITLLPVRYVKDWLRTGELTQILPDWEPPPLDLHAFFRGRSGQSLRARVFTDFLIAAFQKLAAEP